MNDILNIRSTQPSLTNSFPETEPLMQKKILVVEDQPDINALIVLNLEAECYEVDKCLDGNEGLKAAQENSYDLIVLDIMLPGIDGLKICQQLRAKDDLTPILMLTAKKSETDRVLGLEFGADDYLTKPFGIRELQARVKALLRRSTIAASQNETEDNSASSNEDELNFDELTIKKRKRLVLMGDKDIQLTAKEFDLLLHIASHPGQVFNRIQLLDSVWGYQHSGYEHTVNSHINRLRTKLESDPANPKFVLTVWGVGYKFYDK